MEIKCSKFGKKMWLVNSKGRRITPKYKVISKMYYGVFCVVELRDYYTYDYSCDCKEEIRVYNRYTEEEMDFGEIKRHRIEGKNHPVYAFYYKNGWHFYDDQGNLLKGEIAYYRRFEDKDLYALKIGNNEYFANEKLKPISGGYEKILYSFDELGYICVRDAITRKCSMLDEKLNVVVKSVVCDEIETLSKDHFKIIKEQKAGVISKDGKIIIPAKYDDVQKIGDNHFVISYGEKYGLADINGNIIFDCIYDEIMETPDKFVVKDFARCETSKTLGVKKSSN